MAPWDRVAAINAALGSGDAGRIEAALAAIDAFHREFPLGAPDFEFAEAFGCEALSDEVFERLTVRALEELTRFDASLEIAMTAALKRGAAQQSVFVRLVQAHLCRVIEPEHLESDHVFLRLLRGDGVAEALRVEVVERALEAGRLLDFGSLVATVGDTERAAAVAARARAEFDRLGRGHRLGEP